MNILSSVRKNLFWTMDSIKGGAIKKHYREIGFVNQNQTDKKAIEVHQKNLEKVLVHAIETTPFYKALGVSANLKEFPVINKDMVRNAYEDFKSEMFKDKSNTPVFTGGSTGTPFKLFHNTDKRKRHSADNIYYAESGGYGLGNRLYLIRAWHKRNKNSLLFIQRNMKLYGIVNYTDKDMEKLLNDFRNDPSEKCVVCFASMCDILVNYLDSKNSGPLTDLRIKSIITDGDALSKSTKDKMQYYFNTPTVARYGNMECGIMGQQPYSGSYDYDLNWGSFHFELLDLKEDKPAKPGELGRIVVTDLFNYCMPLIRYDTGDLASTTEANTSPSDFFRFNRIEGRKVDLIYDTSGRTISPYMVVQKLSEYRDLKQFQFVQKGEGEYVFKLNPWSVFSREQELISDSKTYLGEDANITIEYVEEIPLLSSGKRKQVLNEM